MKLIFFRALHGVKVLVFLMLLVAIPDQSVFAEAKNEEASDFKKKTQDAVGDVLGDFLAIKTGKIKSGEQIPLPYYKDGKQAIRKECHFMVSPAELPTATTYVTTSGVFYIKCSVDDRGYVQASVWQRARTADGIKMVDQDSYGAVKKQYDQPGVTTPTGEESLAVQQMRILSEKLWVNYMVVALRSQKN